MRTRINIAQRPQDVPGGARQARVADRRSAPAPLYLQRWRRHLQPSRSLDLDGKVEGAQTHLKPSYSTYTYRVSVAANGITLVMAENKDKGSAVMCELCRLDLAGTADTVADEQGRETLAAVG